MTKVKIYSQVQSWLARAKHTCDDVLYSRPTHCASKLMENTGTKAQNNNIATITLHKIRTYCMFHTFCDKLLLKLRNTLQEISKQYFVRLYRGVG